ncbi:MAG: cobyrinic acid a,c-diamide synthase, partial [Alphaproteobacteria bacterium]
QQHGNREVTHRAAGRLGTAGTRYRGPEFQSATLVSEGGAEPLFAANDSCGVGLGPAGLCRGTVGGSFIHLIDRADD